MSQETVRLRVGDKTFECARDDLIERSSYFRAMFGNDMLESSANEIELQEISSSGLGAILDPGILNVTEDNIFDITDTACMLQFEKVIEECKTYLWENLTPLNTLGFLVLADRYSFTDFHNYARAFSLWYFNKVVQGEEFCELSKQVVLEYLSHDALNTKSEIDIFNAIVRWIEHSEETRLKNLDELLTTLHVCKLSTEEFETIKNHLYMKDENLKQILFNERTVTKKERRPPFVMLLVGGDLESDNGKKPNIEISYIEETNHIPKFLTRLPYNTEVGLGMGYKACIVDKDLYLTGGETKLGRNGWLLDVWKYDTFKDQWSVTSQLTRPRRHHSTCSDDRQCLYLIGGFGRHRVVLESVEKYNTLTNEWSTLSSLPTPTFSAACTVYNDHIYIIKHSVQCYSIRNNTWTILTAPIPFENGLHYAVTWNSKIYLTGQYILNLIEFCPKDLSVQQIGMFSKASGASCLIGDKLYVTSGEDCTDIEVCNLLTGEISSKTDILKNPRINHLCLTIPFYAGTT